MENVVVRSQIGRKQEYILTFPKEPLPYPVIGFEHTDDTKTKIKVEIMAGNLNKNQITLRLKSKRGHGINSSFKFYTY